MCIRDSLGGIGIDVINGFVGADQIEGGNGNDEIWGGDGNDIINGGVGNDFINGGRGNDIMDGGIGNDTLQGAADHDVLLGGIGDDELFGGTGNDTLEGGLGDDNLLGNAGDDVLFGEDGDDLLSGGSGDDSLTGGAGQDSLNGGLDFDIAFDEGESLNVNIEQFIQQFNAQATGWYRDSGVSVSGNYIVGRRSNADVRNYAVFDLSQNEATVDSATLRLFNVDQSIAPGDGYVGDDPSETYTVFDVLSDPAALEAGTLGSAGWVDLGNGAVFGEVEVSADDNGRFVEIELNANAIAAINAADGEFAIGGAITTLRPNFTAATRESVFAFSHEQPDVQLIFVTDS